MLIGPAAIAICAYYSKGTFSNPLMISLILTPILMGASVYFLIRKRKPLLRYYRLGFVMRYAKPAEAELKYEVRSTRYGSTHYFDLCRLGPNSLWPSGVDKRISVDIPANENAQTVANNAQTVINKDFLKKLYQGFDPMEKPTLWAKIYFDPDESGSAVIRIADSIFVSVTDNRPPADIL